uniref:hypothetical protein n=1 Tax=Marivirga sericea TaxID=1028 RepID=UPI00373FE371
MKMINYMLLIHMINHQCFHVSSFLINLPQAGLTCRKVDTLKSRLVIREVK